MGDDYEVCGMRGLRRDGQTPPPRGREAWPLICTFESGCRDLNPGPLDPQAGLDRWVLFGAVGFGQVERGFSDLFVRSCWGQSGRGLPSCVDKCVDNTTLRRRPLAVVRVLCRIGPVGSTPP